MVLCQPQTNREIQLGQECPGCMGYPSKFCLDWQEIKIANHEKELVFLSPLKWKVANGETYYLVCDHWFTKGRICTIKSHKIIFTIVYVETFRNYFIFLPALAGPL